MEEHLQAQAYIYKFMFGFVDSLALKSAVELGIADIIHAQGQPISLRHIISSIGTPSPDSAVLERIMRFLVRRKIFTADTQSESGETLYGLTPSSGWILRDADVSLAPLILMLNDERSLAPWHRFSDCVRDGGFAFEKAHGVDIWEYGSHDPDFSKVFNDAMKCTAKINLRAITKEYIKGFEELGLLVDVGGGTGAAIAEIVKAHPHIKGINFDLPHVIAMAPEHTGVTNVGGDMFDKIPNADAIFIQRILHDWSDEDCVKILKNCRKSIPIEYGKVIIFDSVLDPEQEGIMDDTNFAVDLLMIAHSNGGKERTEGEWIKILNEAGFPRYNIIKIANQRSIIEAYPE